MYQQIHACWLWRCVAFRRHIVDDRRRFVWVVVDPQLCSVATRLECTSVVQVVSNIRSPGSRPAKTHTIATVFRRQAMPSICGKNTTHMENIRTEILDFPFRGRCELNPHYMHGMWRRRFVCLCLPNIFNSLPNDMLCEFVLGMELTLTDAWRIFDNIQDNTTLPKMLWNAKAIKSNKPSIWGIFRIIYSACALQGCDALSESVNGKENTPTARSANTFLNGLQNRFARSTSNRKMHSTMDVSHRFAWKTTTHRRWQLRK